MTHAANWETVGRQARLAGKGLGLNHLGRSASVIITWKEY